MLIALPFIAYELANRSLYWRVERLSLSFEEVAKPAVTLEPNPDRMYVLSVYSGWIISLLIFGLVLAFLLRNQGAFKRILKR